MLLILVIAAFQAQAAVTPPPARLALELNRGVCIDRQFRVIPPEPCMRITRDDIRLIKRMGFEFVKVIVNPEPLMNGPHLDEVKRGYVRELVEVVVTEGLPVVVCMHPEWEFKKSILRDAKMFAAYTAFLEETAAYLAGIAGPGQLALQLMTEPCTDAGNWNELQPQLWRAARRAMPDHLLILAGDQTGTIDGLVTTEPVDDANVLYSFTFYDPFVFTLQGAEWLTPKLWSYLGNIPYPCDPDIMAEHKQAILEKIPAEPSDWRGAAEGLLLEYGNARWNRQKVESCVRKLAEWNAAHGGTLRIWCAEFGCYQRAADPEARCRYLRDVREVFEAHGIGWACWSYNETFSMMTRGCVPFGPAASQTPDAGTLRALLD